MKRWAIGVGLGLLAACQDDAAISPVPVQQPAAMPGPLVSGTAVLVPVEQDNSAPDCRTKICRHNENTDLASWQGAIRFVHRTARSQALGPNSSLHVYASSDSGATFTDEAIIDAPTAPLSADDTATAGRDLRDPCFYQLGGKLFIKAITRLPVSMPRDSGVDSLTVASSSTDGKTWTPLQVIGPKGWSFWHVRPSAQGTLYAAAYQDGDASISLFSSADGLTWAQGAQVYGVSADTPLEPEVVFMPSGKMLVLVRMDGTDDELLGNVGRLRTKVCWADPPYSSFACPQELTGVRLDGMSSFFWQGRLFVVARKHILGDGMQKRTALYEITGDLEGGTLAITEQAVLPSAGDTAYAGVVPLTGGQHLVTWYSSDIPSDPPWATAMFGPTSIWRGVIDLSALPASSTSSASP
jgi:hypothetical protein